jgi:hypothetical protein
MDAMQIRNTASNFSDATSIFSDVTSNFSDVTSNSSDVTTILIDVTKKSFKDATTCSVILSLPRVKKNFNQKTVWADKNRVANPFPSYPGFRTDKKK